MKDYKATHGLVWFKEQITFHLSLFKDSHTRGTFFNDYISDHKVMFWREKYNLKLTKVNTRTES